MTEDKKTAIQLSIEYADKNDDDSWEQLSVWSAHYNAHLTGFNEGAQSRDVKVDDSLVQGILDGSIMTCLGPADRHAIRKVITQLTTEREMLIEAMEFYANQFSWLIRKVNVADFVTDIIDESDLENRVGGKRAREVLKKVKGGL